jgi:uncharacterized protein (TIGR03067 family)
MTPALLAVAFAMAAPALKDAPKNVDPALTGRWTLERLTVAGAKLPDLTPNLTLTFTADGRWESSAMGMVHIGAFTSNPKADPHELDTVQEGGQQGPQTSRLIYKIEGDTLTVCGDSDGKRPGAFDTPADSKWMLMVFKRAKKD